MHGIIKVATIQKILKPTKHYQGREEGNKHKVKAQTKVKHPSYYIIMYSYINCKKYVLGI